MSLTPDPKYGLLTPSLPALEPSTPLSAITSHLAAARAQPTKPGGQSANVVISSVGGLGESRGAMPVIPPNGPLAICAVGRAKWEMEWRHADAGLKTTPEEVEQGGTRAVLRCPVGWSGDHRVVSGAHRHPSAVVFEVSVQDAWLMAARGCRAHCVHGELEEIYRGAVAVDQGGWVGGPLAQQNEQMPAGAGGICASGRGKKVLGYRYAWSSRRSPWTATSPESDGRG